MNPVFPAVYSTLCPVALASLITEQYGIPHVQCKLLVRGVGDTYLVQSSQHRYILRIYRSSHRSLPQVKEEVQLLLALQQAQVPASYPISAISGETIHTLQAVEGERYAVLFSYAPGQVVRNLDKNQLHLLGREMARFHNVSSIISPATVRWQYDLQTTLFIPLDKLQPVLAHDPDTYTWLQESVEQAAKKLSQPNTASFSKGYCHFDFLPKNFHFEGDSLTFFDFDFMGYGWLVNDIMTFWQHLTLDVFTGRMTRQTADEAYAIFLEGYSAHRAISEQELTLVPYLSLGFWLFYMAFHTTHDQFYAFSQPAHVKFYTGFLRHVVDTNWEK
jgi:Ser/Thr protein kinase RdoA (MazF antagonist)